MEKNSSKSYWSKKNEWFINAYNSSLIESIKHAPVLLREDLAIITAKLINANSILDLGCGPCRVLGNCLEAIEGSKGYGLDFSSSMIKESESFLKSRNLLGRTNLQKVDLLKIDNYPKSSISIGLGLFDYIGDPQIIIKKSIKAAPVLVASWPTRTFRNYLRRFRYSCNVYTYKHQDVEDLLRSEGFKYTKTINLGGFSGFATISMI